MNAIPFMAFGLSWLSELPWLPAELSQLRFAAPAFLAIVAIAPLLAAAAWARQRRGAGAIVVPSLAPFRKLRRGWAVRSRHLPLILETLALALMGVALARPQLGATEAETLTEGIDILLVLDVSGSMAAEDFQPKNRLVVAKEVLADFIRKRPADRLGLVVFAGKSLAKSPLTTDAGMLLTLLEDIELDTLPDGTAIGVAIASGVNRLRGGPGKSKVMILLTDGINNAGEVDPQTATGIAKAVGIKIYTVGVGSDGPVRIPAKERDPFTGAVRRRYVTIKLPIDEASLKQVAEGTGGKYFRATDRESLEQVFRDLDELEKTSVKVKQYTTYREVFQPVLTLALALLGLAVATAMGRLRVLPV